MRHPHPLPPAFTYTLSEPTIRLMSLNTPYARHVLSKKTHARVSYLYSRDPIWRLSAHSWLTPELSAISRWGDGTRYLGWTSRNEPPDRSSYSIHPSSGFRHTNQILHLFLSRLAKFRLCSCKAYGMFTQSLTRIATRMGRRAEPCRT